MAEGIRLQARQALLQLLVPHGCPEGSRVRWRLKGWVMSCFTEVAMRAVAFVLMSGGLGCRRSIILLALLIMDANLEHFLTEMLSVFVQYASNTRTSVA